MVMDFGFIKELLMQEIHDPCDHGMILKNNDKILKGIVHPNNTYDGYVGSYGGGPSGYKLYLVDCVPTAENLAKHWHDRMEIAIYNWFEENEPEAIKPSLVCIRVYETPNSLAIYPTYLGNVLGHYTGHDDGD